MSDVATRIALDAMSDAVWKHITLRQKTLDDTYRQRENYLLAVEQHARNLRSAERMATRIQQHIDREELVLTELRVQYSLMEEA